MERIISNALLDIVPHASGFLFAELSLDEDGAEKVSFFSYEQDKAEFFPITAKTYLTHKFGTSYREIVDEIGDFLSCSAAPLSKNGIAVVYPSGEMYIFGPEGMIVWKGNVSYQDHPVRDLAVDDRDIWCAVPDCNAVICYAPAENHVTLRIGSNGSKAFDEPVSVCECDGILYVCCRAAQKIRTVRLSDYEVKDYRKFKEPLHKFFKTGKKEYVVLDSGVYAL